MKALCAVLLLLLFITPAFCKKPKPTSEERAASDARMVYAAQFGKAIELDGWTNSVTTQSTLGCGVRARGFGGFCRGGDRRVIVFWSFGPAGGMARFARQYIEPHMDELRQLGFAYAEIRSTESTANFPDGVWDIAVQP